MNTRNDLFPSLLLRHPRAQDGYSLNRLVAASPPLDENSVYCNLLQCLHFADTSVAAELDGQLVGFISAYIPPNAPDSLFVWQVVVADKLRGAGVAKRMLQWLVQCPACSGLETMATTITASNQASWALFNGFAQSIAARHYKTLLFQRDRHFAGEHDDEFMLRISPLPNSRVRNSLAASPVDNLRSHSRSLSDLRWGD